MSRLFFEIAFLVFWITCFVIRYPFAQRTKKNTIVKNQKTPKEKWLLGITFLGMMVLPLVHVLTPWLAFADYYLPNSLGIVGLLLIPPTLWFFYRSHKDLGQNWSASLEVREDHHLVTNGVYKKIRHPMYTAIWLWVIVQALLLQNLIAGLSGIVCFGLLYFLRVNEEEQMMETQFGEEYRSYKKRTNRLFPKL